MSASPTAAATPATHRHELHLAEQRLDAALARAAVDQPGEWSRHPSGLPDWSRGHVVAHLLGNLDGLLNLVTWAQTGVRTPMYPSPQARQDAIDERALWPLAELREAMAARSGEFASACEALTEPLACHELQLGSGAAAEAWELPMLRVREIEIHHVDLADGYHPSDWSTAFVLRTLGQVQPAMAARGSLPVARLRATDTGRVWECATEGPELWGPEAELLSWLVGRPHRGLQLHSPRLDDPQLESAGSVPPAPRWV